MYKYFHSDFEFVQISQVFQYSMETWKNVPYLFYKIIRRQ